MTSLPIGTPDANGFFPSYVILSLLESFWQQSSTTSHRWTEWGSQCRCNEHIFCKLFYKFLNQVVSVARYQCFTYWSETDAVSFGGSLRKLDDVRHWTLAWLWCFAEVGHDVMYNHSRLYHQCSQLYLHYSLAHLHSGFFHKHGNSTASLGSNTMRLKLSQMSDSQPSFLFLLSSWAQVIGILNFYCINGVYKI